VSAKLLEEHKQVRTSGSATLRSFAFFAVKKLKAANEPQAHVNEF
jgi:hypothetical protein